MVHDVGDEEDAGDDKCAEHAVAVGDDLAATDETIADDEEDGAERVENGVERRKKGQPGAGYVDGRMVVDQPGKEERCDGADCDDRRDDGGRGAEVRTGKFAGQSGL